MCVDDLTQLCDLQGLRCAGCFFKSVFPSGLRVLLADELRCQSFKDLKRALLELKGLDALSVANAGR